MEGGEGGGGDSKKPFGVVFASPKGETNDPSEVTIVFNRPMRPLDLAGEEAAPPAKITAQGGQPVKGAWRWIGSNALIFAAPQEGLARATHYDVTVSGDTKSLAGEVIEKPRRACGGEGRVDQPQTLEVNVPPGVDSGTRIRVAGKGEAGPRGAPGSAPLSTGAQPGNGSGVRAPGT